MFTSTTMMLAQFLRFLTQAASKIFFSPGILGRSFLESCHRESRNIGLILCWKQNCTYLLTFSRPSHSCFGLLLFEALLMFQVMQSSPYQINSIKISVYWWQMSPNFEEEYHFLYVSSLLLFYRLHRSFCCIFGVKIFSFMRLFQWSCNNKSW